ncbi:MAG: oxygen-independent coproporphyrinogen III oxidase [Bacteroidota bacterium]
MQADLSSVDLALLKKHDRPGPRYTSYPTAPLFTGSFTAADFLDSVRATNPPPAAGDISLYVHFPFCDTLCYFCGCTMLITRDRGRIAEYNAYLKKEMDLLAPLLAAARRVTQVHWGGGTPTHLTPGEILDLAGHLERSFRMHPEAERSVEIDPRELTRRHLEALRHAGFSRLSMGIQDFHPGVQAAVNRVQGEELAARVFAWARELGFEGVNADLIYGLPLQTPDSFRETVQRLVRYLPDRVAVFNYAHVPWLKPHQKLIRAEDLPAPDRKLEILKATIEMLTASGYEYIGMDHFALPGDELALARRARTLQRNFQGYSTRAGADLYGIGMSAISHFGGVYAQNTKMLKEYYAALDAGSPPTHVGYRMNRDDIIREHVIMRLMCDLEVSFPAVEERFGIRFREYFAGELGKLRSYEEEGLVALGEDSLTVRGAGCLLLRNLAMCFDAYLEQMAAGKPVFSRTV